MRNIYKDTAQSARKSLIKIAALQLVFGALIIALPPVALAASNVHDQLAAAGASAPTTDVTTPINVPNSLPQSDAGQSTLKSILQVVLGIIGAFAFLNITASGMKYISSAGNPQRASEAKNGIVYSLIGLALAISAEAIVSFVVKYPS